MTVSTNDLEALIDLLEKRPKTRLRLRSLLLLDEVMVLPERFDRLTGVVEQLALAQQRTEQQVARLAEAQQRTEERLDATLQALAEAQQRTEERLKKLIEEVRELVSWEREEAGRREGERYERLIAKRAPALFNGGEGGATDQPSIQQRLAELLKPLPSLDVLTDEENPFLADLIWWKDSQFVVVEAALKVNGSDVIRAARRAETLQRARVEAVGLVVGEEWSVPDTRRQAEVRQIDWKVGDDLSDGLIAFRRLPS